MRDLILHLAFTALVFCIPSILNAQTQPPHLPVLTGVLPNVTLSAPIVPACPGADPRCVSCDAGNICIDVRICARGFNCASEIEFTRQRIHIR